MELIKVAMAMTAECVWAWVVQQLYRTYPIAVTMVMTAEWLWDHDGQQVIKNDKTYQNVDGHIDRIDSCL